MLGVNPAALGCKPWVCCRLNPALLASKPCCIGTQILSCWQWTYLTTHSPSSPMRRRGSKIETSRLRVLYWRRAIALDLRWSRYTRTPSGATCDSRHCSYFWPRMDESAHKCGKKHNRALYLYSWWYNGLVLYYFPPVTWNTWGYVAVPEHAALWFSLVCLPHPFFLLPSSHSKHNNGQTGLSHLDIRMIG